MSLYDELKKKLVKQYSNRFNEAKSAVNFVKQVPDNFRVGMNTGYMKNLGQQNQQRMNIQNQQRQANMARLPSFNQVDNTIKNFVSPMTSPNAKPQYINPLADVTNTTPKFNVPNWYKPVANTLKNTENKVDSFLNNKAMNYKIPIVSAPTDLYGAITGKKVGVSLKNLVDMAGYISPEQRNINNLALEASKKGIATPEQKQIAQSATTNTAMGAGMMTGSLKYNNAGEILMRNSGDYFRELAQSKSAGSIKKMASELLGDRMPSGSARVTMIRQMVEAKSPNEIKNIVRPFFDKSPIPVNVNNVKVGEVSRPTNTPMIKVYGEPVRPIDTKKGMVNFGKPLNDPLSNEARLAQEAKKYDSPQEFIQRVRGGSTQYRDYTPDIRTGGIDGYENITKLGIKPEETVTIYRGIDDLSGKVPRKINEGDFVTTDFDSALAYTGNPKDVVSMEVPAKSLYVSEPRDFKDEPFYTGAEYVYSKAKQQKQLTDSQLTDIYNQSKGKLKGFANFFDDGKVETPPITPKNTTEGVVTPVGTPVEPPIAVDTQKYVQEQINKQNTARQVENTGLIGKTKNFIADVKRKLVDSTAPIEDILYQAKKEGAVLKPSEDITNQIDRVYRTRTLAAQFAKDNGLVAAIQETPDTKLLDQYLIAKHSLEVGTETGRNSAMDKKLVDELAPQYEETAQKVIQYGQKLLDYATESGLVSPETNALLKQKYPNYVPLNRIFSELEKASPVVGGSGVASLGKQTIVQRLKGSERAIQNPTESLLTKTLDAFNQGERNIAGRQLASYKDLPGNPFQITPLRTAENVKQRIDLFSQAKELKPIQNLFERLTKTRKGWQRSLESEINKLNQKGLLLSLKNKVSESPTIQSSVTQIDKYAKKTVDIGTDKFLAPELTPTTKLNQKYAIPTKSEFKTIINNLVNLPSSEILKVKKMIATRENNLSPILDQIATMSDLAQGIKSQRLGMIDEARLLKDAESKGLSTFSTLNGGIKEIYQTTPEIATAAKLLDKQQMGFIGKILTTPVRIARVGITGINIPFVGANIAKDQVTGIINSDHALQTSILGGGGMNFLKSVWNAVGHGKEYDNWIRSAGGGTSFDISRQTPNATVGQIRRSGSVGGSIINALSNPLRSVENVIARSEELTRLQQFTGTKNALLKQGMPLKEAEIAAAKASRENTVNFARSGDWGKALNSTFLYINAGIQGSRTLLRNLANRPLQTATKIGLTVMAPLAAVTAWNLSDPQRKAAYDDIRDSEKENNLVVIPPNPQKDPETGKWNVIKIPYSQEIANLTIPVRKGIEALQGYDAPGFMDVAKALLGTTTSLNVQSPNALIGQFTPQAVKMPIQSLMNKNLFTGADIVPQYLNGQISKNLPPEMQVKNNTSGTARIIAKPLGVSPIKVEQAAYDLMGGVGSQVVNASDRLLSKVGVIPSDQIGGQSIMTGIKNRFTQSSGGQQLTNLFDNKNVKNTPSVSTNGLPTSGDYKTVENGGKLYVTFGKNNVKTFDNSTDAKIAIEKDQFDKSGEKYKQIGDNFYSRNKDGSPKVTPMSEISDKQSGLTYTLSLEKAKRADDLKGWFKLQDEQIAKLSKEYDSLDPQNPLDQIRMTEIENKVGDINTEYTKYLGYGGFTKPKKAKKIAFKAPTKISSDTAKISLVSPKLAARKVATNGGYTGFKRPTRGATGQSKRLGKGV